VGCRNGPAKSDWKKRWLARAFSRGGKGFSRACGSFLGPDRGSVKTKVVRPTTLDTPKFTRGIPKPDNQHSSNFGPVPKAILVEGVGAKTKPL
jgi:hypothetical protein